MENASENNPGGPKKYHILVDYDNFWKNVLPGKKPDRDGRFCGLLCDSLVRMIKRLDDYSDFFSGATAKSKLFVDLYGGWFRRKFLSRDAESLSELRIRSRQYFTKTNTPVYIYFQLVETMFSLQSLGRPLYATCRVDHVDECPKCHSQKSFTDSRQKLVDTMLCCDFLSRSSEGQSVAVVTSDDDLVPPLLQQAATSADRPVYHVMTKPQPSLSFQDFYEPLCPDNYRLIFLD